jgi:hypothetical protein
VTSLRRCERRDVKEKSSRESSGLSDEVSKSARPARYYRSTYALASVDKGEEGEIERYRIEKDVGV